jgi:DNA-binding transcriptional LysR family regulator
LQVDLGVSDRPIDLIGEGVDCVIRGGELADTPLVAPHVADLDWVTCASLLYLGARGVPKQPSELMPSVPGHAVVGYFSSLTGVGLDWTRPRQPLHAVYPSHWHLSAKTRLFVDWVAEVFAPFDDR